MSDSHNCVLSYNASASEDCKYCLNFPQHGYNWSTYEAPQPTADKILQGKDLPATIEEVNDDILQAVIACEMTG
ncbi:MAG: hypothetical protein LBP53_04250, partial [Candidatus Peribacteria bacterium]|nr:hypothetical protein [Candidatus Peribacteria bacterium]